MLRDEIIPYTDVNGYVNPYKVDVTKGRQCDNSTLFTSEYYIMLAKRGELSIFDADKWEYRISDSSVVSGLTVRYPGDNTTDAPDNIYAILAASKVLNRPDVAYSMLQYGFANDGFFNASNPYNIENKDGSMDWSTLQWRQFQMLFATYCAADCYRWWKVWLWGFNVYTALVIATSCINTPTDDSDSRRLCWLLIQATQEDSWLCKLAAYIWFKRAKTQYGVSENVMREVAKRYYQTGMPFITYWID